MSENISTNKYINPTKLECGCVELYDTKYNSLFAIDRSGCIEGHLEEMRVREARKP